MQIMSFRWWFENRETGDITIAQFPNWPLWGIGICTAVAVLAGTDSGLERIARLARTALWLYWGGDELLRGVNPWRRVLGGAVIGWQGAELLP
jgi:hypothetical protein